MSMRWKWKYGEFRELLYSKSRIWRRIRLRMETSFQPADPVDIFAKVYRLGDCRFPESYNHTSAQDIDAIS